MTFGDCIVFYYTDVLLKQSLLLDVCLMFFFLETGSHHVVLARLKQVGLTLTKVLLLSPECWG